MDFDNAVKQIVSRKKKYGIGARISYEELNQWLKISSGDDFMWTYDRLSDRLTIEHAIGLELKEDAIVTTLPDENDIKAARKRDKRF